MNRLIQFRVWDTLAKRFIYHNTPMQQHYVLSLKGEFYNLQNGSGGNEYVVQQCTGLKDIDGKYIYEGDIVKPIYDDIPIAKIIFDPNLCSYRMVDPSKLSNPLVTYRFDSQHKPVGLIITAEEILGNIFETPDLL